MDYISNQDLAFLLELIRKLTTQFYNQNTPAKRPGRPPTYSIEIISLTAILLKDKLKYSPDFSTIFYRFKNRRDL